MNILVAYRAVPQSPGWATGDSLIRAFTRLGHNAQPYAKVYQQDLWMELQDFTPDLLVYLECNDADKQYINLLELPCPRVYWEFDTSMHREFSEAWAGVGWNAIFLANPAEMTGPLASSYYLPYAVDTDHFHDRGHTRNGAACIGHPFQERQEFCKAAEVDIVYGVYNEAYADALSRLSVSVHHHDSGGDGLLVGRIWESLGSGCCLLTQDTPTLRMHFTPGKHLMTYKDAEDCRQKARKLLERPVQRMKIARAGMAEALKNHTYVNRAQTILDTIGL